MSPVDGPGAPGEAAQLLRATRGSFGAATRVWRCQGQTQRAAALGVGLNTVKRWDKESEGVGTPPAPTHYRQSSGKVQPLHPDRKPAESEPPHRPGQRIAEAQERGELLRKGERLIDNADKTAIPELGVTPDESSDWQRLAAYHLYRL